MRARGLIQAEVAQRGGFATSNLSRIMSGRTPLSATNQRLLAAILDCSEAELHQPIGSRVPPPQEVAVRPAAAAPGFDDRLVMVLALTGIERLEDLVNFLVTGDFSALPARVVRRMRARSVVGD